MKHLSYTSVAASATTSGARTATFLLVLGLHVTLVAWVSRAPLDKPSEPVPIRMAVRTLALPAQKPREIPRPVAQRAKALPQAERPVVRPTAPLTPSVLAAVPHAEQAPATAPQPSAPVKEEAPPMPAPVIATAARFDADYLQNTAPVFPALSRKMHEEGKVLLLVQVSASGEAEHVQIKQGSGYIRLDEAAVNAVRKWRFIPARRGSEPVASSVVVPIAFRLDN
ncbi:TonB family protein [Noviherbaspirillum sp.]|uniref:TonB family protein n=1 Tax=Noviherbaspirillum sp. TaxID=1926288 RepID=UPI002B4925C7|nr:TonB family protein [Noviherbaspirillum sp.]HJV80366.1 TonB family protein [Noviherbaspirillum sp.]